MHAHPMNAMAWACRAPKPRSSPTGASTVTTLHQAYVPRARTPHTSTVATRLRDERRRASLTLTRNASKPRSFKDCLSKPRADESEAARGRARLLILLPRARVLLKIYRRRSQAQLARAAAQHAEVQGRCKPSACALRDGLLELRRACDAAAADADDEVTCLKARERGRRLPASSGRTRA